MSAHRITAPDPPGFKLDPRVIRAFGQFSGGYWKGESALGAWALTLGLAGFLILSMAATVGLNHWNRWFFDALERRDMESVVQAVFVFAAIIVSMAAVGVGIVLTRETLQVRWRAWIVERLVARWLGRQRFYHLNVTGREPPNPEYRISDDTRWATEPLVDLGIGLFLAVVSAAAFISILWTVGGSITFEVGETPITIPAYMVLLALAYGAIASSLMIVVGAPLVGYVGRKNETEGYFRFAMMRIRDNAETVALMDGARYEKALLDRFYASVIARWLAIVWQHGHLTWITNASGPMIPIVPLLFAAPKYIAGELSLGQVTQLAAAFVQVQIAISWLVDNYNRFAEWYASARRVMDIVDACDAIDLSPPAPARPRVRGSGELELSDVSIADGNGRTLVSGLTLAIAPGEAVHIAGDSSTGKSMLVRAVAGLWPLERGSLRIPEGSRIMIAPQKSYLPLGTLKEALLYPDPDIETSTACLCSALERTGLGALKSRLDELARWDQVLSNGERQRLAIARLLIHAPDIVILDDALCALDEASQQDLLLALRTDLAGAMILSLGQRPFPPGIHDRQFVLEREADEASLKPLQRSPIAGPIRAQA
jgi:putative ATP-binding cassette transporter